MTRRRIRIALLLTSIAVLGVAVGWVYYSLWQIDIHEAYAASDTGTLLVNYMHRHDNQWPSSWDALLSDLQEDSGERIMGGPRDMQYVRSLAERVSIDWSFDPARPDEQQDPITRPDGSPLRTLWEGRDPNQMVRDYLAQPATRPSVAP